MISPEDEERIRALKWSAALINGAWYAVNATGGKPVYLHRFIMGNPEGCLVDHANGDTTNCCRWNLRVATRLQNNVNRRKSTSAKWKYKGVRPRNGKWEARLGVAGQKRVLGRFDSEEEAARAYDQAATSEWGSFARLNFPDAPARRAGRRPVSCKR